MALARETAAKLGVKLTILVAKDREFDMGVAKLDLILLSYVEIRENAARVIRALAPDGIVVAEYFHQDSVNAPGGRFADNELLRLFEGLRILRYEDTEGVGDFGMQKRSRSQVNGRSRPVRIPSAYAPDMQRFRGSSGGQEMAIRCPRASQHQARRNPFLHLAARRRFRDHQRRRH